MRLQIRTLGSLCLLGLVSTSVATPASAQTNPFLDVVDALTGPTSKFNGPDRGGPDTLHGEVSGHWWTNAGPWGDYKGLDFVPPNPPEGAMLGEWDPIPVPRWQDNSTTQLINPREPNLPRYDESDDTGGPAGYANGGKWPATGTPQVYIVTGRFLVGATLWPHEEFVEQYRDGTLTELTDEHKVPVYWLAEYALFIPHGYGDPANPNDRNGKALIVHGTGGQRVNNPDVNLPPWLNNQLSRTLGDVFQESSWTFQSGIKTAVRLQVPVLQLRNFPEINNTWRPARANQPNDQGGVTGYHGEGRVAFGEYWAAVAPEANPVWDYQGLFYAATYVRGRTFLDGFFDPTLNAGSTAEWSTWDEIVELNHNDDPDWYIEHTGGENGIDDVLIEGGSKRGHAVWLAAVSDDKINGAVSNGMAYLRASEVCRLHVDELWEQATDKIPNSIEYKGNQSFERDPNQLPPNSPMQNSVEALASAYRGERQVLTQYFDVYSIFKDRDVMQDENHPGNPQPEVWMYCTQGMQDVFWARQEWAYWLDNEVFHGRHQYYDFDPFAIHGPYYEEFSDKMQGFCEAVWFQRPMPEVKITDLEYDLPYQGEPTPPFNERPLRLKAEFSIANTDDWPLKDYGAQLNPDDPQNFQMRLCIGLRPVSDTRSRGMWTETPSGGATWSSVRSTPWWEIAPIPGTVVKIGPDPDGTVTYQAEFEFVSDAYADIDTNSPFFPIDFESMPDGNLNIERGIPAKFHSAFYMRCAVEHEASEDVRGAWPVRRSTSIEYLPPWGVDSIP